ncbi:MAG: hypothetical protein ACREXW_20665 [Gammaproteobacteria bacterium]
MAVAIQRACAPAGKRNLASFLDDSVARMSCLPGKPARGRRLGAVASVADASLRLHTFATVLGLTLVSLAKIALGTEMSARVMMRSLAAIDATLVRTTTGGMGRRATAHRDAGPGSHAETSKAVEIFDLGRWLPSLLSTSTPSRVQAEKQASA